MNTTLINIVQRLRTAWGKASRHENGYAPRRLLDLPLELLVDILLQLSWSDILRIRRTCKQLAKATTVRAIWVHVVNEHMSDSTYPPRLERPIDMYTSTELERCLLLWKSAEKGWETETIHPARERIFAGVKAKFLHVAGGGRWLLVTENTAAVTYYDLDQEKITGVSLIPDQVDSNSRSELLMCIDDHTDSPMLQFTIAFSLSGRSPKADAGIHDIRIWRVSLILNDIQRAVGLEATQVASFRHRPVVDFVMSLSLLGPNVAFTAVTEETRIYAYVVDWTRVENSVNYLWRVVQSTKATVFIYLLPNNRLFVTHSERYQLSDYSMAPETVDLPNPRDSESFIPLLWMVRGNYCMKASKCFFRKGKASVVMGGFFSLFAINIDDISSSDDPRLVELMDYPNAFVCGRAFLGHDRSISIDYDGGEMTMISYKLPVNGVEGPGVVVRTCTLSRNTDILAPAVDEESGRMVYMTRGEVSNGAEFVVVDFATIFQSQFEVHA